MAREPKKLNLKSKINIEKVDDKIEINIKTIKKEPKKLNLKSKVENRKKIEEIIKTEKTISKKEKDEALNKYIEDTLIQAEENIKKDKENEVVVEKETEKSLEEIADENVEKEMKDIIKESEDTATKEGVKEEAAEVVEETTTEEAPAETPEEAKEEIVTEEPSTEEVVSETEIIDNPSIETEITEETSASNDTEDEAIEITDDAIDDVIDFSNNEEDKQYALNELANGLNKFSEVKNSFVEENITNNDTKDIIETSAETKKSTPIPIETKQETLSAETIALLKEIIVQNNMSQSNRIKRKRVNSDSEMEVEIATHLNNTSSEDEIDNLSTSMTTYSHGLTDEEIKTMSFADILKVILQDADVTDINFNGKDLFIQNNKKGRYLFSREIKSSTIENFVRDIVNTLNNQFNTENPIVDCEIVDAYSESHNKVLRLNAVHESISPYGNTMSIRITQPALRLNEADDKFASEAVFKLLEAMIRGNLNILISGRTGSGKTELQKFLIKNIRDAETIVLIEDTKDTNLKDLYPEKNITSWITNSKIKNPINFDSLIKASLRNNPDWIIISETRGSEAYSMIKSGLSGHKIITTLHSDSAETNVDRLIHMCKEEYDLDQLLLGQMITSVFDVGVHLDYDVTDNGIIRYVCEIVEYKGYDEDGVDVEKIFEVALQPVKKADGTFTYQKVYKYGKLSEELFSKLAKKKVLTPEISRFIKEEYYGKEIK